MLRSLWNRRLSASKTEWIERTTFVALTRDGRMERAWIEEDRSPNWSD